MKEFSDRHGWAPYGKMAMHLAWWVVAITFHYKCQHLWFKRLWCEMKWKWNEMGTREQHLGHDKGTTWEWQVSLFCKNIMEHHVNIVGTSWEFHGDVIRTWEFHHANVKKKTWY
jgi:hypothetical protein